MGRIISDRLWLGKGLHKGRKVALTIPELGLLPVKYVTAQCRFRTVVIRTAVALFSHRCRIALLAFALLTFALLSLRTVDPFALLAFALVSFTLLSFALLSYKYDDQWFRLAATGCDRPRGCHP